ncbi:hypothetical protein QJQ45_016462 [Haematococcus lacustris]|nr:hypothetical protein QJQ45_016462 [Haematococcus lacustris]
MPAAVDTGTKPAYARLAVADELGLLKIIETPGGPSWGTTKIVQKWGEANRQQAVVALAAPDFLRTDVDVLACARGSGQVDILDSSSGRLLCTLPIISSTQPCPSGTVISQPSTSAAVRALAFNVDTNIHGSLQLVSCTASGTLCCNRLASSATASHCTDWAQWQQACSFQAAPHVACMAVQQQSGGDLVALGGDGCQLQVWSLSAGAQVFAAKGAKPNRVGNVDLPHLTAAVWLPDPPGKLVLAGTVKHKLWLYDLRAGKRPQLDLSWGEARITALAAQADGCRVWAANGTGHVEALDLRSRTMQGALKGSVGSVTALALHPDASQPLIATAGLDRHLRVYCSQTRALVCKLYCKQQLSGSVWLRPVTAAAATEAEQAPCGTGTAPSALDPFSEGETGLAGEAPEPGEVQTARRKKTTAEQREGGRLKKVKVGAAIGSKAAAHEGGRVLANKAKSKNARVKS